MDANINNTINRINELYTNNLNQHGLDSKSVGWKDLDSQNLRFDVLARIISAEDWKNGFSFNDYGCGYGAMYLYFKDKGCDNINYSGYDISQTMLDTARHLLPNSDKIKLIRNKQIDIVSDYTFVSGTFNVRFDMSDEEWFDYVKNCLVNINEHSRKGFAFNLLTSYVDWKAKDLHYANAFKYFDFCKTNLSKLVTLYHDYPLFEWTIAVKK